MYVHMRAHAHTHAHTRAHTHMHTYTHVHAYIRTYMCLDFIQRIKVINGIMIISVRVHMCVS